MIRLAERATARELGDDPGVGYSEYSENLREIARFNRHFFAYRPTLEALDFFWRMRGSISTGPLRILDVGSGYGDFLRRIYRWAEGKGIHVEMTGLDVNPWSTKAAIQATPASMSIRYITGNLFDFRPRRAYEIILSSQLTHHFTDEEIVEALVWMNQHAVCGWFISDLHRHWLPYHFVRGYVGFMAASRLTRNDGPLSVARAFTRADWERFLDKAEIDRRRAKVIWRWPFRYCVRYCAAGSSSERSRQ